jgi:hypothetical protein
MAGHSKIGASGMYRWSKCPGSVRLSDGIVDESSQYAIEGTAAHQLAETCLTGGLQAMSFHGQSVYVGEGDKTVAIPVTTEMADAVQVYLDAVRFDAGDPSPEVQLMVEQQFDLGELHSGLFGTSDAVILYRHGSLLRVYDYKHGKGLAVEVEGNPQLMYYALGCLMTVAKDVPVKRVEIIVVQPRCEHPDGPVRRWAIDAVDLIDFAADLVDYAKATEAPDAPLVPGVWCKFCKAAAICPKLKADTMDMFENAKVPQPGEKYDAAVIADVLRKLPAIEAWIEAVREFAYQEANRGSVVPGFKLVEKQARRKWADEDAAMRQVQHRFRLDYGAITTPPKLLSPAQIEKLLDKEDRAKLADLVTKESSGTTLVPVEDKRPAVATVADFF